MRDEIRRLMRRRANLLSEARDIVDAAEAEDRGLSAEEEERYDALMDDVNDLTERIQRLEEQRALQDSLDVGDGTIAARQDDPDPDDEPESRDLDPENVPERYRELVTEGRTRAFMQPEYRQAFRNFARRGLRELGGDEYRALQADDPEAGGYLLAPMQLVNRLIQAVDDNLYIRQWSTNFEIMGSHSLGAPSLDADPEDGTWSAEIESADEDTQMDFGQRELTPHELKKLIKVSEKLLRRSPSVEDLIVERFQYKFGVTREKAYLTGSGAQQPLGVFTAADEGISTSRDVSTGNTTTEITFDNCIEVKYTLKQQYWPMARWVHHRDAVKKIAKLKDGDGQYIWRESVRVGEPDRILGFPSFMSEYAPNTFTTGQYVGVLGDFSHYWTVDDLMFRIKRLDELYARTSQVGFIGDWAGDGMPVLEEAFVRQKLA